MALRHWACCWLADDTLMSMLASRHGRWTRGTKCASMPDLAFGRPADWGRKGAPGSLGQPMCATATYGGSNDVQGAPLFRLSYHPATTPFSGAKRCALTAK